MKGSIEYTRNDGKIDGGNIVEHVEIYSGGSPRILVKEDGTLSVIPHVGGKSRRYVVAIAEVD